MTYKGFVEVFTTPTELQTALTQAFNFNNNEIFDELNWIMPLQQFYSILWNVFASKSYNKLFIWNTANNEFSYGISGQFLPLLWTEIVNFYKNQIVLLKNDIKDLKDYLTRGNQLNSTTTSANTQYSQPADKGYDWNINLDAPTNKNINDGKTDSLNRINDIYRVIETNMNIYFNDIWFHFERFFVSAIWYNRRVGRL